MSCAFVASASAAMAAAESLCLAATGQVLLVRGAGRNPEIQGAATAFAQVRLASRRAVVATSSTSGTFRARRRAARPWGADAALPSSVFAGGAVAVTSGAMKFNATVVFEFTAHDVHGGRAARRCVARAGARG